MQVLTQTCVCSALNLRCEHRLNPIGIDSRQPLLSWMMQSDQRQARQHAYQIIVSSGPDSCEQIWDSGKIETDQSTDIIYDGMTLESRKRYHWRVRIWNEKNESSDWSELSFWEMGLLRSTDWQAHWIEPLQKPTTKEPELSLFQKLAPVSADWQRDYSQLKPVSYMRREFIIAGPIDRARVYATAHGIYQLEINGKRVGDFEFAPEATAYDHYLQYQTYDVADLLDEGENTISACLAEGWYSGRIGLPGDSCQYGERQALLLQLEIETAGGHQQIICSDTKFKSATGPLVYSDLFIGEEYDARLEISGWSQTGYDDRHWKPVLQTEYGLDHLVAQASEPIRRVQKIRAVKIIRTPQGETVIDFGQNIFGRVQMQVCGAKGTAICLEHSEMLDENGNFLQNILGRNKDQKDFYICGGNEETYEPWFTGHGFRFVRLTGYPGNPDPDNFTAVVLASDLTLTGDFVCSDPRLTQLQKNIVWSQRSNLVSIPTDCPQRERAGFTGDAQVYMATACFNMDVQSFMCRWLKNMVFEQRPDGQIPTIVPYWKSYDETFYPMQQSHTSAGWGDACIIVPWTLYLVYGDTRVLSDNYQMMKRWLDYVQSEAETGLPDDLTGEMTPQRRERQRYLWNSGFHFGDWLIPSLTKGYQNPFVSANATKELIACCFYGYSTALFSKIAQVLGCDQEAKKYHELNCKIRQAFEDEYLQADGRFKNHYQGTYVLALKMNMVSDTRSKQVAGQLANLIRANGFRLDTGFVAVPYLLDVLCENGYRDVATQLLYQTECPSWLYPVEQGATTIWETWDAVDPDGHVNTASFNHYAFGAVGDWMYRNITGISAVLPGYKHFQIKPVPDDHLTFAHARFQSIFGEISSNWSIEHGEMSLTVKIPANTKANIFLPKAELAQVRLDGDPLTKNTDVSDTAQLEQALACTLGSGEYHFTYPYPAAKS